MEVIIKELESGRHVKNVNMRITINNVFWLIKQTMGIARVIRNEKSVFFRMKEWNR